MNPSKQYDSHLATNLHVLKTVVQRLTIQMSQWRYDTTEHPGDKIPHYSSEFYDRCLQQANWYMKYIPYIIEQLSDIEASDIFDYSQSDTTPFSPNDTDDWKSE